MIRGQDPEAGAARDHRRRGGPISSGLSVRSLPAATLLLLCVLRPIEIHPEAAACAGLLAVLVALGPEALASARLAAPLAGPLAAYLVPLLCLNILLGCEPHAGILVLARWSVLGLLAAGLAGLAREGARVRLAFLGVLAGAASSAVALRQGLFGHASVAAALDLEAGAARDAALTRLQSGRVWGTFALPASLGGALALTLPLTVALAAARKGRRERAGLAALALVQAAALAWSFSIGAWVSLGAAATVVLAPSLVRGRRGRRALVVSVIAAGLLLAAGLAARRALLPAPGPEDRPLLYRSGNWIAAAEMVRDHPLFGTGIGTFGNVFPAYRAEGMNESRYAHCTWLQLVAELGLGVLPLLALAAAGAWLLVRRSRSGDALGVAAAIGALAFLAQNLVDFTAYQPAVGALFVLAAVLAATGPEVADPAEATGRESGSASARGAGPEPRLGTVQGIGPEDAPAAERGGSAWPGDPRGFPEGSGGGRSESPGFFPAVTSGRTARSWLVALAGAAAVVLASSGLSDLARERAIALHGVDPGAELRRLRFAAAIDPLDPEAQGDLAGALAAPSADTRALEQARSIAARAVALDPRTPFRRRDLAFLDLRLGRPAEAWAGLVRAATLYPMSPGYRQGLEELETRLFAGAAEGTGR